jgi:hypothetical protein
VVILLRILYYLLGMYEADTDTARNSVRTEFFFILSNQLLVGM